MRHRYWIILGCFCCLFGCNRPNSQLVQGYIEGTYRYLSANAAGVLEHLYVAKGDVIKSQQQLFVLDQEPEVDSLHAAQANLQQAKQQLLDAQKGQRREVLAGLTAQCAQAKATLDFAHKTFRRYQKLYWQAALSEDKLDQAHAAYLQAQQKVVELEENLNEAKLGARENLLKAKQAAVTAAAAEVAKAQWGLKQKRILAPFAARVFDTYYEQGELVPAGKPIVALLSPQDIKVIFFVTAKALSKLHVNQQVTIACDGCGNEVPAQISYISPQAEYTPPVIYSEHRRAKLVYRIEAKFSDQIAKNFNPGQPVDVILEISN